MQQKVAPISVLHLGARHTPFWSAPGSKMEHPGMCCLQTVGLACHRCLRCPRCCNHATVAGLHTGTMHLNRRFLFWAEGRSKIRNPCSVGKMNSGLSRPTQNGRFPGPGIEHVVFYIRIVHRIDDVLLQTLSCVAETKL